MSLNDELDAKLRAGPLGAGLNEAFDLVDSFLRGLGKPKLPEEFRMPDDHLWMPKCGERTADGDMFVIS